MKYFFISIITIILLICIINYIIDFVFYLKNRYCRFHIGRFNEHDWKNKVEKIANKWIKRTPTVKISDNSRYILLDVINKKYRSNTIQSWQKAALILALYESENANSTNNALSAIDSLFDKDGMWKTKPTAVDCGMLSFAALIGSQNKNMIKPAMDYSLSIIMNNINEDGMISYTSSKHNPDMYVDTIGLTVPFLAAYANFYNNPEIEKIAYNQIHLFQKYGLLENTNIPNHAFNIKNKLPLGVFGWGRGIGWYVIGLMDSYFFFKNPDYKNEVKQYIERAAEEYIKFQHEDGGFGSIIQSEKTYDSSATAVLAWFYAKCYNIFNNPVYSNASKKCLQCLLKNTRITGAIDWCQGDTKGIGIFAQTYDIMPFAQGMALRAINLDVQNKTGV